jgi:hypothetical protein
MRIIEGTVAEIVEYQQKVGTLAREGGAGEEHKPEGNGDPTDGSASGTAVEGWEHLLSHVDTRARNPAIKERAKSYLEKVRSLGTQAETGESQRTSDGRSNYIMVRDQGLRRFGAVAYVRPATGGVTVRLRADEVEDLVGDDVRIRSVRDGHEYAVVCRLTSDEAVEAAVELTRRALAKVRR